MTALEYRRYLRTPAWRARRETVLRERGRRCSRCGAWRRGRGIQVHHVDYSRLGAELETDLEILCGQCHKALWRARRAAA